MDWDYAMEIVWFVGPTINPMFSKDVSTMEFIKFEIQHTIMEVSLNFKFKLLFIQMNRWAEFRETYFCLKSTKFSLNIEVLTSNNSIHFQYGVWKKTKLRRSRKITKLTSIFGKRQTTITSPLERV